MKISVHNSHVKEYGDVFVQLKVKDIMGTHYENWYYLSDSTGEWEDQWGTPIHHKKRLRVLEKERRRLEKER